MPDVNKDGCDEFIAGAGGTDPGGKENAGTAYIYSGIDGSVVARFDGEAPGDLLGSAAYAGDVNANGLPDFILGAWAADPGGRSDAGSVYVVELDMTIKVLLDIKPGSYPNAINLGSKGLVPVAILSSQNFDANSVDANSVTLAGAGVAVRGKGSNLMSHLEDVNADGLLDLVIQVETENLDVTQFQEGRAILTGETLRGLKIEGSDEIRIVPPEE